MVTPSVKRTRDDSSGSTVDSPDNSASVQKQAKIVLESSQTHQETSISSNIAIGSAATLVTKSVEINPDVHIENAVEESLQTGTSCTTFTEEEVSVEPASVSTGIALTDDQVAPIKEQEEQTIDKINQDEVMADDYDRKVAEIEEQQVEESIDIINAEADIQLKDDNGSLNPKSEEIIDSKAPTFLKPCPTRLSSRLLRRIFFSTENSSTQHGLSQLTSQGDVDGARSDSSDKGSEHSVPSTPLQVSPPGVKSSKVDPEVITLSSDEEISDAEDEEVPDIIFLDDPYCEVDLSPRYKKKRGIYLLSSESSSSSSDD